MAYISSKIIGSIINTQLSISVEPYTKLLNLLIIKSELIGIFSTEGYNNWNGLKTFNFRIMRGVSQFNNYIDDDYIFFDTIKVVDDETIEFYHLFFHEIKTLDETRDKKIDNFLNQEF